MSFQKSETEWGFSSFPQISSSVVEISVVWYVITKNIIFERVFVPLFEVVDVQRLEHRVRFFVLELIVHDLKHSIVATEVEIDHVRVSERQFLGRVREHFFQYFQDDDLRLPNEMKKFKRARTKFDVGNVCHVGHVGGRRWVVDVDDVGDVDDGRCG